MSEERKKTDPKTIYENLNHEIHVLKKSTETSRHIDPALLADPTQVPLEMAQAATAEIRHVVEKENRVRHALQTEGVPEARINAMMSSGISLEALVAKIEKLKTGTPAEKTAAKEALGIAAESQTKQPPSFTKQGKTEAVYKTQAPTGSSPENVTPSDLATDALVAREAMTRETETTADPLAPKPEDATDNLGVLEEPSQEEPFSLTQHPKSPNRKALSVELASQPASQPIFQNPQISSNPCHEGPTLKA